MGWREDVRKEITELVHETGNDIVTRQEIIARSLDRLSARWPKGKSPDQTLSRVLQDLRDDGMLEFVRPGTYRVLTVATRGEPTLDVRDGKIRIVTAQVRMRPYQKFMRSKVLPNFDHACGVCGIRPEWFLDAAHLRPVVEFETLAGDPSAAIALCKNHHIALDAGALVIHRDLRIEVHRGALEPPSEESERAILSFDGKRLRAPRIPLNPAALPSIPSRAPDGTYEPLL